LRVDSKISERKSAPISPRREPDTTQKALITQKETNVPAAYEAFLRGSLSGNFVSQTLSKWLVAGTCKLRRCVCMGPCAHGHGGQGLGKAFCGLAAGRRTPSKSFHRPAFLLLLRYYRMGRTGAQNLTHATHRPIPPTFTRGVLIRPAGRDMQAEAGRIAAVVR
jgi:hypothetical protein